MEKEREAEESAAETEGDDATAVVADGDVKEEGEETKGARPRRGVQPTARKK
jgi:hypothetical protein